MLDIVLGVVVPPGWNKQFDMLMNLALDFRAVVVPWRLEESGWLPSFTRNLAGRWSRRKLVTFVDVDAVMHPDWGTAVLDIMDDENYEVAITVKTKMTLYPWNGPKYLEMLKSRENFEALLRATGGNLAPGTGCGTVTTTGLYEKLGGLEEDFKGYGPTDWDFTRRLDKAGIRTVDMTEEMGIILAHQHHKRTIQDKHPKDVPCKTRNVGIMNRKLKAGELRRNKNGWGGLPW
jgi:predicted glycosyltransferase involved in capsule biosynthesis